MCKIALGLILSVFFCQLHTYCLNCDSCLLSKNEIPSQIDSTGKITKAGEMNHCVRFNWNGGLFAFMFACMLCEYSENRPDVCCCFMLFDRLCYL